jgi:hypothetical protein
MKTEVKTMYTLKCNEVLQVNQLIILRVPGGWIYENTFVPYNDEFIDEVEISTAVNVPSPPLLTEIKPVNDKPDISHLENDDTVVELFKLEEKPKEVLKATLTAQQEVKEKIEEPVSPEESKETEKVIEHIKAVNEEETELDFRIRTLYEINSSYVVFKESVLLGETAVTFKSLETMPEAVFNSLVEKFQSQQPKKSETKAEAPVEAKVEVKVEEKPSISFLLEMITDAEIIEPEPQTVDPVVLLKEKFEHLMKLCKENNIDTSGLTFEGQTEESVERMNNIINQKIGK